MTKIIDGKSISSFTKERIKEEIKCLKAIGINVSLAVIIVGEDKASQLYVANKRKACESLGIMSETYYLPENTSQKELLELIDKLNKDKNTNGILVQLPLPVHLDEKEIINAILPEKDVDAFHPVNVGKIMHGDYDFVPCTPAGIMEMLKYEDIDLTGKHCVIIGRSNIVGKPMAMLMLHKNATVTICHSKTENIKNICKQADILVVAIGKPNFVNSDYVKPGAVVIDVGINRFDGKFCGDVNFDDVEPIASAITPVPGGVGPMTIAMLMKNTLTAALKQNNL
jgi:methylenetetrahydrofolate dehydrogenase (NADP+)/methenyltetrahydrofolate cyclohydrolase